MKKNGVTKRTWDRNARKFADVAGSAWRDLNAFVESNCKRRSEKEREAFCDNLCEIVDMYVEFNCAILTWCHKNGVDPRDFVCDVENLGFQTLKELALNGR